MKNARGFTLVEVLLAIGIFSVIAVSLTVYFQTSLSFYVRLQKDMRSTVDAELVTALIERDLHNVLILPDMPPTFTSSKLSFVTHAESFTDGVAETQIAAVTYEFANRQLIRTVTPVKADTDAADRAIRQVCALDVQNGKFSYAFLSPGRTIEWRDAWQDVATEENIFEKEEQAVAVPRAITVSFDRVTQKAERGDATNKPRQVLHVARTVLVPVGTLPEAKLGE